MKRVFPLILLFLVSCGPAVLPETATPTASATLELLATPTVVSTASPDCLPENFPCPSDSMTLTAVMGATFEAESMFTPTPPCDGLCAEYSMAATAAMGTLFAAIPGNTPPAGVTIIPSAGDLGWGAVYGIIVDGNTNLPLEGASVTCEHFSYTSVYRCDAVTTTNSEGIYSFGSVFFHDTDRITLIVEAPGYTSLRLEETSFTRPEFRADLGLFPLTYASPTPVPFLIMCTPPACSDGVLVCGGPDACPAGCGAI